MADQALTSVYGDGGKASNILESRDVYLWFEAQGQEMEVLC
jgi:hypothetical protein